jgi:transcriptional regulator with XRE-family HTH domain
VNQKAPNPIDVHVGARLRMRRLMLGMSQEKLGDALGLTFQQVQKYEKGTNRISASRLLQVAEVLNVPPSFFFDDAPDALSTVRLPSNELTPTDVAQFFATGGLALIKAFSQIRDAELCRRIVELVETIADSRS